MRLHVIEHDEWEGDINVDIWARRHGYELTRSFLGLGEALPEPSEYDWLVVAGGSQHAWETDKHPWLAPEKEYLSRVLTGEKVVLGICFGAQLIAEALGGKVFKNSRDEIGWRTVTLTPAGRKSFLFEGVPDSFLSFHWHSDHFTLPPGAVSLAQSDPTPNQAYALPDLKIVGLQFHPEHTLAMVEFFTKNYGPEWRTGPYVKPWAETLEQTKTLPDTYELMDALLGNMLARFGPE